MKRVRITLNLGALEYPNQANWLEGEEYDCDEALAKKLIARGHGIEVAPRVRAKAAPTEVETVEQKAARPVTART